MFVPRRFSRVVALAAVAILAVPTAAHAAPSYSTENPAVLVEDADSPLAIVATPDRALYRRGALPRITIRAAALPDDVLSWQVRDAFGTVLDEGSRTADSGAKADLELAPGHGYYEVVATIERDGTRVASARRSIGALTEPPPAVGDEPFGLWIQGSELYPELGVRWTREGIYWRSYASRGMDYLENRIELFEHRFRDRGIRVIAYPKHPHPNQVSREVIEDTPEAWRELETWWTEMVRTLAGHVDAWAVINEPTWKSWKGDNELILRYWQLMRRIVDRYDPETPLLGPSLSTDYASQLATYQDLLDRGFGELIDVVEMHTYTDTPEESWGPATRQVAEMTRKATGRSLPVWSTEHGYTATYDEELEQARLLVRSLLEAKRIGYPVVIWHMFGNPQGSDRREVQFAIFRGARERDIQPQPRPAGLAYGATTRQLAGATYQGGIEGLPPGVESYVFARGDERLVALSSNGSEPVTVTLAADPNNPPTITGMFGHEEATEVRDGEITVTLGRDPIFIGPLPAAR